MINLIIQPHASKTLPHMCIKNIQYSKKKNTLPQMWAYVKSPNIPKVETIEIG